MSSHDDSSDCHLLVRTDRAGCLRSFDSKTGAYCGDGPCPLAYQVKGKGELQAMLRAGKFLYSVWYRAEEIVLSLGSVSTPSKEVTPPPPPPARVMMTILVHDSSSRTRKPIRVAKHSYPDWRAVQCSFAVSGLRLYLLCEECFRCRSGDRIILSINPFDGTMKCEASINIGLTPLYCHWVGTKEALWIFVERVFTLSDGGQREEERMDVIRCDPKKWEAVQIDAGSMELDQDFVASAHGKGIYLMDSKRTYLFETDSFRVTPIGPTRDGAVKVIDFFFVVA
ncbi:MAG: hypothetical protein WC483_01190 [Candidatus Paceibacterota bacterium]